MRLHIEAALICGTDLKVFKRGYHAKMIVPPAGASIVPGSGLFSLRLPAALANTTATLAIRVTDNGSPNLSGTNTFTVIINPLPPVDLTPLTYANGQFRLSVIGSLIPDYVCRVRRI